MRNGAVNVGQWGALQESGARARAAGGRHEGQDGGEDATIDVRRRRARLTLFIHVAYHFHYDMENSAYLAYFENKQTMALFIL